MEYTNGTKATWRYWVWKRIRERIKVNPKLATILFLSGPSPEDLVAAKANGFRVQNLVAIDTNAECVEAARQSGCCAVQGDIHDVFSFWNDGPVHGVVADYCCGLSWEQYKRSQNFMFMGGPVALNFQRGRESSELTSSARDVLDKLGFTSKHRGDQFIAFDSFTQIWVKHFSVKGSVLPSDKELLEDVLTADPKDLSVAFDRWELDYRPELCSYRSNVVVMDSIVFNAPLCSKSNVKSCAESRASHRGKVLSRERRAEPAGKKTLKKIQSQLQVIRRLNAAKAIRTMNGAVRVDQN